MLYAKRLKEGTEIEIIIKSMEKTKVKDIFGALKEWKIDSQKFKNEIREED